MVTRPSMSLCLFEAADDPKRGNALTISGFKDGALAQTMLMWASSEGTNPHWVSVPCHIPGGQVFCE